jgi:hypothetical protein
MISFVSRHRFRETEEVTLVCPKCGEVHTFYYCSPDECMNCDAPLPDVIALRDVEQAKLGYHRETSDDDPGKS